jgi:hypothetical protein
MNFVIDTFVGAEPLRFGMTPQQVRKALPGPVRSFRCTPGVEVPSDQFVAVGVIVNYRAPGVVDSIEFSRPANPIFRGVALFSQTLDQVKSFLLSQDPELEVDSAGFISYTLGLGIYALMEDPEEGDPGEMLSIIAFENGYYGRNRTSEGSDGASEELE